MSSIAQTPTVTSVTLKEGSTVVGTTINKTVSVRSFTLTADVQVQYSASKSVTWDSSNKSVATVADGVVTIVGAGTTTIKATAVDDSTKKDSVSLVVGN